MDYAEIEKLSALAREQNLFVDEIKKEISSAIIGQDRLVERMIIAFITGGHILLEGLPGLAKTLAVKSFARCVTRIL